MGWLGVALSAAATWLLWDNGILLPVAAIAIGIIQFWSWGVMHNHAVMAARSRRRYSGKFYDLTREEVDSAPNWVTAINMISFVAALAMFIAGLAI